MSDKVVNWDLHSLPLQDLCECLHDQLTVKGIWGAEKAKLWSSHKCSVNPATRETPHTACVVTQESVRVRQVLHSVWRQSGAASEEGMLTVEIYKSTEKRSRRGQKLTPKTECCAKNTGKIVDVAAKQETEEVLYIPGIKYTKEASGVINTRILMHLPTYDFRNVEAFLKPRQSKIIVTILSLWSNLQYR